MSKYEMKKDEKYFKDNIKGITGIYGMTIYHCELSDDLKDADKTAFDLIYNYDFNGLFDYITTKKQKRVTSTIIDVFFIKYFKYRRKIYQVGFDLKVIVKFNYSINKYEFVSYDSEIDNALDDYLKDEIVNNVNIKRFCKQLFELRMKNYKFK